MNPFNEKPISIMENLNNWTAIYPVSYRKNEVDPYTKTRVILMNGTEYEANWFSHQFSRHCDNADLRRQLALVRYVEKQQQMRISVLKPIDETILETTIGYEQLAVDLTAALAKHEPDIHVKNALDFALLEDFDHLYRYANLLEDEHGIHAEALVGKYTEIMPGRPTISHHRHPYDNVKNFIDAKTASPVTKLNVSIITAAEQQTMNYYMNQSGFYTSDVGRQLYQEIGLVEEEHVTLYGGLMDPNMTWLEHWLCHEYTECYLYYSCFSYETNEHIKKIWEQHFIQEVSHLHYAAELLQKYENKQWQQVIPDGEFPALLKLEPNIECVRKVLGATAANTSYREEYINVADMPENAEFFEFQNIVDRPVNEVPSHFVIDGYIRRHGQDYRFETEKNPIESLRDRKTDNVTLGNSK